MKKRVGILTLPLHSNYGGIIQAICLYQYLSMQGFEVFLINKRRSLSVTQKIALTILENFPFQNVKGCRERSMIRAFHMPVIQKFIPKMTRILRSEEDLTRAVQALKLDAVIVGSDQVWRMEYSSDDEWRQYFLNFVTIPSVRRIAYAASFGIAEWQHPERVHQISELLAKFDSISVREDSGVTICKRVFNVEQEVEHSVDPTMLINQSFFETVAAPSTKSSGKTFLTYLLDSSDREAVRAEAVRALGPSYRLEALTLKVSSDSMDLPHWLRALMDADYVMTDSFHGTIFSILFGKPFIAIANTRRGADRFYSLLGALGLRTRLMTTAEPDKVDGLIAAPIDFDRVYAQLDAQRQRSAEFLNTALS